MADLKDVIAYACRKYPHAYSLPVNTLTKILYLADWRSALTRSCQLTSARWFLRDSGPYTPDLTSALSDPSFIITCENSFTRRKSFRVSLRPEKSSRRLTDDERQVLDFVLSTVASKHWTEFVRLVNSTYPVYARSSSQSPLDLVALASEYQSQPIAAAG